MYELRIVRERRTGYPMPRAALQNSSAVASVFHEHFGRLDREQFVILLLDAKNRSLGFHVVSTGILDASLVHPREVFKVAILANAAALIALHNHPSGDPVPSAEDRVITGRLAAAGSLLGIRVVDHLIIGEDRYFSFADAGQLDERSEQQSCAAERSASNGVLP